MTIDHHDHALYALHDHADALVAAVHALDPDCVDAALRHATEDHGPDVLRALVVVLAAAVHEDVVVAQHVSWVDDPDRYWRMRQAGLLPWVARAAMADIHDHERGLRSA